MKRTRRGVSLVELLLIMSACSVILTLSAGLIHRAMMAQAKTRAFADAERSALRLGRAFRADVHAATEAITDTDRLSEGTLLRLRIAADEAIEYRQSGGSLERVRLAGDAVQAREAFAFPAGIKATAEEDDSRLLVLSIITPPVPATASPTEERPLPAYATSVSLRVAARLSRHSAQTSLATHEEPTP